MSQEALPGPSFSGFIPLTTGRALDRIFRLFRAHILLFLRIASVPAAGMVLVQAVVWGALIATGVFRHPQQPPGLFRMLTVLLPAGFIAGLVFGFVYAIFEAAGTYAGLRANAGLRTSMRTAYRVGLNHAGRYLWLMVLRQIWIGLPVWAGIGVIAGLMFALSSHATSSHPGMYFAAFPLLMLMYLGAMVYAVLMWIRLSLAVPVSVAENATASAALRRSLVLTKDAKGRIFVVILAVYAAAYVAMMALEIVVGALGGGGVLLFSFLNVHPSTLVIVIGAVVLAALFTAALLVWMAALSAAYVIAYAVLYHDQRLRMEGVPPLALEEPA
jgi:hypothetical protein